MADSNVTDNVNKSFLKDVELFGYEKDQRVSNILEGAQLGIGYQPKLIDAATPIVFPPVSLIVLQTPTMYDSEPKIGQMIKSVIESHAKAVSGLDISYTLDTSTQPAGHDGQEQEVPLQTKRSAPSPSFTFPEVSGNLIWNLFRKWIWDISHPDTNISMNDLTGKNAGKVKPFTMSAYSMSMLAVQFDPTYLAENIIDAVFYTNMFPKETGELGLERTIGTSKNPERTIPFSAIAQHNHHILKLAKDIVKTIQVEKANYSILPPGITKIESGIEESGLRQQVDNILQSTGVSTA